MTFKQLSHILKEYPWLWGICNYWIAKDCNVKIIRTSIDKVNFTKMLGDFDHDSIDVFTYSVSEKGYLLNKLGHYPFGPSGMLIEYKLCLQEGFRLLNIAVLSKPEGDHKTVNLTIFCLK